MTQTDRQTETRADRPSMVARLASDRTISRDEESALIAGCRAGDRAATERLVKSHLGFVRHIARRHRRYGQPLNDLIQEGTLGLLEAIRRFDPSRNVRLATYAAFWIRASIQDHILRSRSLVRVGTTAAQKALLFGWGRRFLPGRGSAKWREEGAQLLARKLRLPLEELRALARRLAGSDGVGAVAHIETIPDPAPTPEDALVHVRERRARLGLLVRAIRSLPAREREIIRRRFFCDGRTSRTAVGHELGLSKERVRQLEARALARLKSIFGATTAEVTRLGPTRDARTLTQHA